MCLRSQDILHRIKLCHSGNLNVTERLLKSNWMIKLCHSVSVTCPDHSVTAELNKWQSFTIFCLNTQYLWIHQGSKDVYLKVWTKSKIFHVTLPTNLSGFKKPAINKEACGGFVLQQTRKCPKDNVEKLREVVTR